MNMVSEPKAHLTKTKATKRQKEKSVDLGDSAQQQQMIAASGGSLMAYYMSGVLSGRRITVETKILMKKCFRFWNSHRSDSVIASKC